MLLKRNKKIKCPPPNCCWGDERRGSIISRVQKISLFTVGLIFLETWYPQWKTSAWIPGFCLRCSVQVALLISSFIRSPIFGSVRPRCRWPEMPTLYWEVWRHPDHLVIGPGLNALWLPVADGRSLGGQVVLRPHRASKVTILEIITVGRYFGVCIAIFFLFLLPTAGFTQLAPSGSVTVPAGSFVLTLDNQSNITTLIQVHSVHVRTSSPSRTNKHVSACVFVWACCHNDEWSSI